MFDIQDDDEMQAMYAQLSTIMAGRGASQDADSQNPIDDDGKGYESGASDEDYEAKRARKLIENQALLAQLGLGIQQPASPSQAQHDVLPSHDSSRHHSPHGDHAQVSEVDMSHDTRTPKPNRSRRGRPSKSSQRKTPADPSSSQAERSARSKKAQIKLKFAEDGTTTSNPLPGTTHGLAYVDMPPINERRRDDYVYVSEFLIRAPTPPPPPSPTPSPSPPPDKKRRIAEAEERRATIEARKVERQARKAAKEARREERIAQRAEAAAARAQRNAAAPPKQRKIRPSGSSSSSGIGCHQCRRRSDAVMRCSQFGIFLDGTKRRCPNSYCRSCMDFRYGAEHPQVLDETWDPQITEWACPRCRAICNCTKCLEKGGLHEYLQHDEGTVRMPSLSHQIRGKDGTRIFPSVRHYLESKGVKQIGKPGVTGAVADDDEEGQLMARLVHLTARLKQIRGDKGLPFPLKEVKSLSKQRLSPQETVEEDGDDGDEGGDDQDDSDDSEADDSKSSLPSAFSHVKRIVLRVSKVKSPLPNDTARRSPPVNTMPDVSNAARPPAPTSSGKPADQKPAPPPLNDKQLKQALKSAVESQVWVRGIADLTDSDSDLTDLDDDDDIDEEEEEADEGITRTQHRTAQEDEAVSEDSALTSLSDCESQPPDQTYLSAVALAATAAQPEIASVMTNSVSELVASGAVNEVSDTNHVVSEAGLDDHRPSVAITSGDPSMPELSFEYSTQSKEDGSQPAPWQNGTSSGDHHLLGYQPYTSTGRSPAGLSLSPARIESQHNQQSPQPSPWKQHHLAPLSGGGDGRGLMNLSGSTPVQNSNGTAVLFPYVTQKEGQQMHHSHPPHTDEQEIGDGLASFLSSSQSQPHDKER